MCHCHLFLGAAAIKGRGEILSSPHDCLIASDDVLSAGIGMEPDGGGGGGGGEAERRIPIPSGKTGLFTKSVFGLLDTKLS